jgi:aminoacyl-tRNA hydrolase
MRSFLLPRVAALHRRRLGKVTFVGITGSAGKTTATTLAIAVLATAGKVRPWAGTLNIFYHIMAVVIATKPSDNFCVVEFGIDKPGSLDRSLATVRPRIGVVTSIGTDHLTAFHSIEAIAAEKAKLIACLPENGTAVLNADDPRVMAMADRVAGNIITFGRAEDADLRAEHVRSPWPERLSFTAIYQGTAVEVRSQLCGTHWTSAVLAALGVGLAAGVPLDQAAKAIASVQPYHGRMYPVTSDDGVTFIVDDRKSPVWAMASVFDFLAAAQAPRKILVIGTVSDYAGSTGSAYAHVAKAALGAADHVIFVGPMATHALRAKRPENAGRLHAFATTKAASDFLQPWLHKGDLVVLKGSMVADHLGRLAHHRVAPISCWRMDCGKNRRCSACRELRADLQRDTPPPVVGPPATEAAVSKDKAATALPQFNGPVQVLIGIGNPGSRYENTPHNVGWAVLDALAERLELAWAAHEDVLLAHTCLNGETLLLVKPQSYVNNTGQTLLWLAEALGFKAEDCILIQDDIHLPLGKLRSKAHGSDGGHKGVRSVLVTFQTDAFCRLKIGVAPAALAGSAVDYLLTPFPRDAAAAIDSAINSAADRLLWMLGEGFTGRQR